MAMDADLITRLAAAPLPGVGANVTWGERVQGTPLPGLSLMIISPGRDYVHAGPDATGHPRVQFSIYATNQTAAHAIASALTSEMETARTVGTTAFSRAVMAARRGPVVEDVGAGGKASRIDLDFYVWFSPA